MKMVPNYYNQIQFYFWWQEFISGCGRGIRIISTSKVKLRIINCQIIHFAIVNKQQICCEKY